MEWTLACRWVGERFDQIEELDNRPGPAVSEKQRCCVIVGRTNVDEMNVLSLQLDRELWVRIDGGFCRSPLVLVRPVGDDFLDLGELCAVHPLLTRHLVGPPSGEQPATKIIEIILRDVDGER